MATRCLLVDDNGAFLEAARILLAGQGLTVAGTASNTAEALLQVSALHPDVAVVDVGLGDESGFDLARHLAKEGVAVIMISTDADTDYADLVTETSAAGFLPKMELSATKIRQILGSQRSRG